MSRHTGLPETVSPAPKFLNTIWYLHCQTACANLLNCFTEYLLLGFRATITLFLRRYSFFVNHYATRIAKLGPSAQLKDYEKALKYFNKALDKNPNNPYAILNKGYVYQMQGERGKAIKMYERLIAMDPPDRAVESTDSLQAGKKLTDIAKDNIKSLKTEE